MAKKEKKVTEVAPVVEVKDSPEAEALKTTDDVSSEVEETIETEVAETIVEDTPEETVEETTEEVVEEVTEDVEAETVAPAEEEVEEVTEETESTDEVESLQADDLIEQIMGEGKDNTQKRIDELTREKYELLEQLKEKGSTKEEKVYTVETLKAARAKAIQDNDLELLDATYEQQIVQLQDNFDKKLKDALSAPQKEQDRKHQEYLQVVKDFAYLADETAPELYRGSKAELNVRSNDSILVKTVDKLLARPELQKRYSAPGRLHLAVNDALRAVLKRRLTNKPEDKEKKLLKRKVKKAEQKGVIPVSTSVKTEKTQAAPTQRSDKQVLADFVKDSPRF